MNRTVIVVVAAAALVIAFIAGNFIDFDQDGSSVTVGVDEDGPVERAGEAVDDAVDQADQ